jgi:SAM-dependent methyltransferase
MSELTAHNPTGRFSGLASAYARHRPDYPADAVEWIVRRAGLVADSAGGKNPPLLIDVGCGTGISSRQFAQGGVRVTGIEPNDDMRRQAEQAGGMALLHYQPGKAEQTGLADGCADCVLAAQAFHWFDASLALAEFHRILRPGGWVALVWNERDPRDACTAAYGAIIAKAPDAALVEGNRAQAGEVLLRSPLFGEGEKVEFTHRQDLDEEGLLGRAFSASYAPRQPPLAEAFAAGLRDVFARFQRDGRVGLQYVTTVYMARRPPAA